MFSYTFCKLISTSNGEDANRDTLGAAQNQYNRRLDKSVAYNEDTPHNFRVSYIYDLPIGRGKSFLSGMPHVAEALFGNWKVSAIHTYVSGTPLWISCNQNLFGAGQNQRCSFAPGVSTGQIPLINPNWTWSHDNIGPTALGRIPYLNPAASVLPPNMTYGDTPRQISYLRRPWTVNEDLAILKNFIIHENASLEVRASPANTPNPVVFGARTPRKAAPTSVGLAARATARAHSARGPSFILTYTVAMHQPFCFGFTEV